MSLSDDTFEANVGDLVDVISNYKDVIAATGLYLGTDSDENFMKILTDGGKIEEFDLTFYYLEKL